MNQGSIPGRVIPKTQKIILDTSLLKTQHYKVRIKHKVGYITIFVSHLLNITEVKEMVAEYKRIAGAKINFD